MSDDALIRLSNLKSMDLSPTQLSERVGGRYTYWRDLLAGEKSFGERIARKIEEKLELPRGHLDASEAGMRVNPEGWPFKHISYARFAQLPSDFLEGVEKLALSHVNKSHTPIPEPELPVKNVTKGDKGAKVYIDDIEQEGTNGQGNRDQDQSAEPVARKSAGHRK